MWADSDVNLFFRWWTGGLWRVHDDTWTEAPVLWNTGRFPWKHNRQHILAGKMLWRVIYWWLCRTKLQRVLKLLYYISLFIGVMLVFLNNRIGRLEWILLHYWRLCVDCVLLEWHSADLVWVMAVFGMVVLWLSTEDLCGFSDLSGLWWSAVWWYWRRWSRAHASPTWLRQVLLTLAGPVGGTVPDEFDNSVFTETRSLTLWTIREICNRHYQNPDIL